jgi:hypothetical protein
VLAICRKRPTCREELVSPEEFGGDPSKVSIDSADESEASVATAKPAIVADACVEPTSMTDEPR